MTSTKAADRLKRVKADMKPSGLQPAMFTPGSFTARTLEAAAMKIMSNEVQAAIKLMARATQVSRIADKGMREIVQRMLELGYKAETIQNKAFYTTTFTKENEEGDEHTFHMLGWHGTGRYVGGEKTILEFYDDEKSKTKPVVSIGAITDQNINVPKQQEVIQHIMEYVKKHG